MKKRIFALAFALVFVFTPVMAFGPAYGDGEVSVIVLFAHEPEEVREARARAEGYFYPRALAGAQAEADHYLFRAELAAMFGITAMSRTAEPYTITHEYRHAINGAAITLPASRAAEMAAFESVAAVLPNKPLTVLTTGPVGVYGNPIGMSEGRAAMRADEMHGAGFRGAGVLVAVVDTGIDYTHPAFAGAFPTLAQMQTRNPSITAADTVGGIFYGRNFHSDLEPNDPMDTPEGPAGFPGHGTHVAGTVAGRDTGEILSILGVAPEAMVASYRVLGPSGGTTAELLAAIDIIMLDKPCVVNMSLGVSDGTPFCPVSLAVNNAMLVNPHMTFVAAAGNEGEKGRYTVASPGTSVKAITVGSADYAMKPSYFSSRGPVPVSHEIAPDIVAHGQIVYSAVPWWSGLAYSYKAGTSMAAPHVSGAAALLVEYSRRAGQEWGSEEIKARLMNTAIPLWDYSVFETGAGYADVYAAAHSSAVAYAVHDRIPTDGSGSFASGSEAAFNLAGWHAAKGGYIENKSPYGRTFTLGGLFTANPGGAAELRFSSPEVYVPAYGQTPFSVWLRAGKADAGFYEGYVYITEDGAAAARMPFALAAHAPVDLCPECGDGRGLLCGYINGVFLSCAEKWAIIDDWNLKWDYENLTPAEKDFVDSINPIFHNDTHNWWTGFREEVDYWYYQWNHHPLLNPDGVYIPMGDVEAWIWGLLQGIGEWPDI